MQLLHPPRFRAGTSSRKTATAAAAVAATPLLRTPVYGQNQAPSANVAGANNRIQVAIVGVGFGIGQNHLNGIQEKATENNTVITAAVATCSTSGGDFAKTKRESSRMRTFTMITASCSSARTLTRC